MRERGILMRAEGVWGILDGKKTHTRRVIKPQPSGVWGKPPVWVDSDGYYHSGEGSHLSTKSDMKCPYGVPGDRLWVRETLVKFHRDPPTAQYKATATAVPYKDGAEGSDPLGRALWQWKRDTLPSIHMPKWASRITLEIKDVRVERVQDIRPEEIKLEGASYKKYLNESASTTSKGFGTLMDLILMWNSINEKRGFGWDVNPCVWVVVFEKIKEKV